MKTEQISWKISSKDAELVGKIADRAQPEDRQGFVMDMMATHANGNPMDFEKLLSADDFNFNHDVYGIERHLDRETGKLRNCFSPRCSARS